MTDRQADKDHLSLGDIYPWDYHSDQPHVIKDKKAKRRLYIKGATGSLKTLLTSLTLPIIALSLFFKARTQTGQRIDNIGLCINIDNPLSGKANASTTLIREMVDDLGVEHLLIRLPLSDIENLDQYAAFIKHFGERQLLVNILQDRRHIEDTEQFRHALRAIFTTLGDCVTTFQIGNAVNRRKWAFVSLDEYFHFFAVAQQLRDKEFPAIQLLGGNIIDFELPNFARSLIHAHPIHYDATTALLYVDRRGAPENTQMGCDLIAKINWFYTIIQSSRKSYKALWITETNWPLEDTEPYAPAVGECMVDEKLQAAYLVRYYLLMMATGRVTRCYWHQLVAPGYGLVDNRGNSIRKREAYSAFKTLLQLFNGAEILALQEKTYYRLTAKNAHGTVEALWTNGTATNITVPQNRTIIDQTGRRIAPANDSTLTIGDSVIYLLDYDSSLSISHE